MAKRKTSLICVAALFVVSVFGQSQKPVFSLETSDGVEARGKGGTKISPKEGGERVLGGLRAAQKKNSLVYDIAGLLNNDRGTVMFWVKDGSWLTFKDGKENKLHLYSNIFNGVNMSGNGKRGIAHRQFACYPFSGSWYHLAVCWEKGKQLKFFVNGVPWAVSIGLGNPPVVVETDVASAKELVVGFGKEGKIDSLKIYDRALKTGEIYNEYRRIMPIDLVMENSSVYADEPASITLNAAPGGYYTIPNPDPKAPFKKASVKLKAELFNDQDELILLDEKTYNVQEPMDIKLPERTLPVGLYKLKCTVKNGNVEYMRMFDVTSVTREKKATAGDDKRWKRGRLLYERVFDSPDKMEWKSSTMELRTTPIGSYVECSPKAWERMSTEIVVPKDILGKPCLLDITWPDDKPRIMGLYMFPIKGWNGRDRLGAGIQAGEEFTNSGKMRTTSYLFYPNAESYLFEARSFGMGSPAAIAAIRLYELDENFPVLKIRKPENLPGRQIGFYDEDQSYMWLLNDEAYKSEEVKAKYPNRNTFALKETMRYFDYAGTTGMLFGVWRYDVGYTALENHDRNFLFPFGLGQLGYIMEGFQAHDKAFLGYVNLIVGDPALKAIQRCDNFDPDLLMIDRYGERTSKGDPSNPAYQDVFISNFVDLVRKYATNPMLGGLYINLPSWGGKMKNGYGDSTIKRFTKETGIQVPKTPEERYKFLTGEKKKEWTAWRKGTMTKFHKRFRAFVDKYNPNLKLYSDLIGPEWLGLAETDWREIQKIPNWFVTKADFPYGGRRGKALGGEPGDKDEIFFDFKKNAVKENYGYSLPLHTFWETYYETNLNTLLPKKYNARFQAPNVKPVGRNYLKLFAYSVAMNDSLNIYIGGQPLSTAGVEDVSREFAQAYAALPALPFKTVPGGVDPVAVRYLPTENGTYFYAVNTAPCRLRVKVNLPGMPGYLDLSTGKTSFEDEIELLPYQLRSFLIPEKKMEIKSATPVIDGEAIAFFQKRFDELEKAMKTLEGVGISCAEERKAMEENRAELAAGHLSEVHRLNYSLLLSNMMDKVPNIENYAKQSEMMGKGHYSINVGSYKFDEFNGKLFFPDQRWRGNNNYGYLFDERRNPMGAIYGCMRDIENIHGTEYPDVYRTETYSMDGYCFKVPNGTYKVRMYMKVGYRKAFKPENYRFRVNAQGKFLTDVSLYDLQKGDVDQAVVLEKEVKVDDGLLNLEFMVLPTAPGQKEANGTERFLNAVEVIPVH